MANSDLTLMQQHIEALFIHDDKGRLVYINEPVHPERHPAPLVYVGRTDGAVICRCRSDLPDALCTQCERLVERDSSDPLAPAPGLAAAIRDLLEPHVAVGAGYGGPAFWFPEELPVVEDCIVVDRANASLMAAWSWEATFDELTAEVEASQPFVAAVVDGQAVAVCRTVRRTPYVVEAGVETLPAFRRRGLGAQVVARWAFLVREAGITPLYSAAWENMASRRLAAKLGLVQYGTDLDIFAGALKGAPN
jgi:hypothetical protein